MRGFLKYIGLIVFLLGAIVVALPVALGEATNGSLLGGLITMMIGIVSHIILNRRFE